MSLKRCLALRYMLAVALLLMRGTMVFSAEEHDLLLKHLEGQLQARGVSLDEQGLIRALEHEDSGIRQAATMLLGRRQQRSAIPALQHRLTAEPLLYIRVETAQALAVMDDDAGHMLLRDVLQAQAPLGVRFAAALALTDLNDPSGYPVVLETLTQESKGARLTGIDALRKFIRFEQQPVQGKTVAIGHVLDKILQEEQDPIVRMEAVMVLADSGNAAMCQFLQSATTDPDARVRLQAEAAWQRLGCNTSERKKP